MFLCLSRIIPQKQINKSGRRLTRSLLRKDSFYYVTLVSGVHLISRAKLHFLNALFATIVKSNVCLLAMRKDILSTIALREELNSFFPIILGIDSKSNIILRN